MTALNEFEIRRRDCLISAKALHNLTIAHKALTQLIAEIPKREHLILSSFFHHAAIRYAKPFQNSALELGTARFPFKSIKDAPGFSVSVHEHLLEVRNTLIAHDDFDAVLPRLIHEGPEIGGHIIPLAVAIANVTILYPTDVESAKKLETHVEAAAKATMEKLVVDMAAYRQCVLAGC
ncbi:MAG TPA: hypothetical protein VG942_12225 [Hyphomonadaceae bacterium]|nr:hypothetical protein [Hyphomonadaceae bacterium]